MMEPNTEKFLRYIKEESTTQESLEIETWMQELPSNRKYVETIAKAYFAQATAANIKARQQESSKSFELIKRKILYRRISLYTKRVGQVAAAIIAVFLLSTAIAKTNIFKDQMIELHQVSVKANPGMRTDVVLPDGTHIWLNSGSEIRYSIPFKRETQEIELIGQAFFDVAHNPDQPFKINVDKELSIKVLGTQFNVMAYPQEEKITVLLTQGSVAIDERENSSFQYLMQVNDELTYDRTANTYNVIKMDNAELYTSWTENRLAFKDTPITEVFQQLSHYYDVKITIQDSDIEKYRFTGVFNNKTLPYILKYLEITSNIRYEQEMIDLNSEEGKNKEHIKIYNQ